MKKKVNLNGARLQEFLLAHVEKVVVGAVFLGFCFLVYSALSVETYPKTPDELATTTNRARTTIERTLSQTELQEAIDPENTLVVRNYEQMTEELPPIDGREVARTFVPFTRGGSTSGRRSEPEYLALASLRADASNGPIALLMTDAELAARQAQKMQAAAIATGGQEGLDEAGRPIGRGSDTDDGRGLARGGNRGQTAGDIYDNLLSVGGGHAQAFGPQQPEETRPEPPLVNVSPDVAKAQGLRWVVLTGLVPVRKQAAEFRAKFEDTGNYSPDTDYPLYVHFEVERAEAAPGQATGERNWQPVDVLANTRDMEVQFAQEFPVDCDEIYRDPVLTRQLPPLLGRNWGDSVVHKPEIEMLNMAVGPSGIARGEEVSNDDRDVLQPVAGEETGQPGGNLLFNQGGGRNPYGGSDSEDAGGGRTNRRRNPYASGRGNRNPYSGMRGGHGGNPYSNRSGGDEGGSLMGAQTAEHLLFRFFDYSVEPGNSYVYRVRLKLANPNYGLPSQMLESSDLSKAEFAYTPWTEMNNTVKVPGDSYLLAGPVQPARGAYEPSVKVFVESFDINKGLKASELFTLKRGDIAGERAREVKLIDPLTRTIENQKLDFDTDTVLLDMIGGETLGDRNRDDAPGMLLLLDEAGNLVVRRELGDKQKYDAAQAELDRIKNATQPASLPEDSDFGPDGRPRGRTNRGNTSAADS